MSNELTYKIYSKDIEFVLDDSLDKSSNESINNEYKVIAKDNIKCGTLILLEHVLVGDSEYIQHAIAGNRTLFNELCPRRWDVEKWGDSNWIDKSFDELLEEKNSSVMQINGEIKAYYNVFLFSINNVVLGRYLSKFNHACKSNALVTKLDCVRLSDDIFIHCYGVYATSNIKAGDEICMDYTYSMTPLHYYICDETGVDCHCDTNDLKQIEDRYKAVIKIILACMERDKNLITNLVDEYLKTKEVKYIVTNQLLAKYEIHNFGPKNILTTISNSTVDSINEVYKNVLKKIDKVWN
jgi:hypothetical protein